MEHFTPELASALPGPGWLSARRRVAAERAAGLTVPSPDLEIWRYSRIGELDLDGFSPVEVASAGAAGPPDGALPAALAPMLEAIGPRTATVVTRNGGVAHVERDDQQTPGVRIGGLDVLDDGPDRLGAVSPPADVFGALNDAFLADAVIVDVPDGVAVRLPVVVVHWLDDGAAERAVFPRTLVRVGEAAEVTVVELVASERDLVALTVPVTELEVGQAGVLRYVNVQDLGHQVWQIGHQGSRVARDATLTSASVALGGDYARVRTDSRLIGQGGTSNLLALYFGEGTQVHDFRTLQDHDAPKTTSDLLFKGAVADHSRSVYSGLIRVRKGAAGTNAYQTNRNLVLSEGAHADSVPNLEIEENDVRCSHASAVGPIDEQQRFYLESRGVPPEVADRLIVLGFLADVIDRSPVPALRAPLAVALGERLARATTDRTALEPGAC